MTAPPGPHEQLGGSVFGKLGSRAEHAARLQPVDAAKAFCIGIAHAIKHAAVIKTATRHGLVFTLNCLTTFPSLRKRYKSPLV